MEMGSSSLPASVASGSNDSLNGLKFGKKIYFEDVGSGGNSSKGQGSGSSAAKSSAPALPKKGKGVVQGGQQPPRCQVAGCNVDLSGAKAYYSRHKVCGMHSKSPKVIVGGIEQRFCQQCSRFHQLPEFDQGKRSCRRRLAGHNERRRKPPAGSLLSRIGRLSSSFNEDSSGIRGFLMDFSHPRLPTDARDIWPTIRSTGSSSQWQGSINASSTGIVPPHGDHDPYMQGSSGGALFATSGIPAGQCIAGVSDSSCALSLLSSHQPWGTTAIRNRAPSMSGSSSFDAAGPMAPAVVAANNNMTNSWGFKGHEAGSSSHGVHHDMGLGFVAQPDNGQYSGELELALQGNRQCMDLDPGRAYGHSDDVVHWSL